MSEPADLLAFDGDCAFCTVCADIARRRVAGGAYRVVPWQHLDLSALGLTRAQVIEAAWFLEARGSGRWHRSRGHLAIAAALTHGRPAWRPLGRLIGAAPLHRPADALYRLVARNRHRLPGGTAACAMPPPPTVTDR